jgi:hypothetical protein
VLYNNLACAKSVALDRGFTLEDIIRASGQITTQAGLWQRLHAELGRPKTWTPPGSRTWKTFEQVVANIYRRLGGDFDVQTNQRATDQVTGELRELDVTLRSRETPGSLPLFIVIECKDQKAPVGSPQVEAFVTKLRDIGAHKGVMVSASGFSAPALTKATHYAIEAFSLEYAHEMDWTSVTREVRLTFPFPTAIELVPVLALPDGWSCQLTDATFTYGGRTVPFVRMISEMSEALVRQHVALPARLLVRYEPPAAFKAPDLQLGITEAEFLFINHTKSVVSQREAPLLRGTWLFRETTSGAASKFVFDQ